MQRCLRATELQSPWRITSQALRFVLIHHKCVESHLHALDDKGRQLTR